MKKRVCILASFPTELLEEENSVAPRPTATWLPQIARGLEGNKELEIIWLVISGRAERDYKVQKWGQKFYVFSRWKHSVSILTRYFAERRRFHKVLDQLNPDLIHAWGTEEVYGLVAAERAENVVLSMQGLLQVYCTASPQPFLLRCQARHEAWIFKRIHRLTVESPWGLEHLRKQIPHGAISLLEYGVNPAFLDVRERRLSPDPLCVYVGTLGLLKGTDVLLRAFRDRRLRHVRLVMIGDGPLRPNPGDCPENIRCIGRIPPSEIADWLQQAWALVHPTRADTSPNCVKEARVLGLPVITTPNGGQLQYVRHEESGWIHDPDDIESMIAGVLRMTESPDHSLRYGKSGQEECREALSPKLTLDKIRLLYKACCDGG